MTVARLDRHELVDVEASAWAAAFEAWRPGRPLSHEQVETVEGWVRHGWPAIGRRGSRPDRVAHVAIGLPLPPALGKLRIALSVPRTAVRRRPPVPLALAREVAPRAWRDVIASLEELGKSTEVTPATYGALLWQHFTGMSYLHPNSDLDVLWAVRDESVLDVLLDGLMRLDASSPVRLDGEVITPAGGVNWRELSDAYPGGREVLVKTAAAAVLSSATSLFEGSKGGAS